MAAAVTREEFEAYVQVQKSGKVNMFAVGQVCELSGLERSKVLDIMDAYGTLAELYRTVRVNHMPWAVA